MCRSELPRRNCGQNAQTTNPAARGEQLAVGGGHGIIIVPVLTGWLARSPRALCHQGPCWRKAGDIIQAAAGRRTAQPTVVQWPKDAQPEMELIHTNLVRARNPYTL